MGYIIDYVAGELVGCSSQVIIADRIFYVKLFTANNSRFFSGDQEGTIQKEISKTEFDLWISVLADNEIDVDTIQKKLLLGRKY